MEHALAWISDGVPVQLGVVHFNERAIAFYKKLGFEDTGREHGRHRILRRLMVRRRSVASDTVERPAQRHLSPRRCI